MDFIQHPLGRRTKKNDPWSMLVRTSIRGNAAAAKSRCPSQVKNRYVTSARGWMKIRRERRAGDPVSANCLGELRIRFETRLVPHPISAYGVILGVVDSGPFLGDCRLWRLLPESILSGHRRIDSRRQ
jgi:hypothetical protein